MKEKVRYFGAYWHGSNYSLEENANLIYNFLNSLKEFNPVFYSEWFLGANSKELALKGKLEVTKQSLERLLKEGVVKMPNDEVLCYRIGFWNGATKDEDSLGVSFTVGGKEDAPSPNNCIVNIGYSDQQQFFFQVKENREKLVQLLKKHWNPEYVKVDGQVAWVKVTE